MPGDATLEGFFEESNRLLVPQITFLADIVRITRSGELPGVTFPTAHQVVMQVNQSTS